MDETEDKDFSWTPEYGWRTCIRLLFLRSFIVIGLMIVMILFVSKDDVPRPSTVDVEMAKKLGLDTSQFHFEPAPSFSYDRRDSWKILLVAIFSSYILVRKLMNATGLSENSLFWWCSLAVVLIWCILCSVLLSFDIGPRSVFAVSACCVTMICLQYILLKFQDAE